MKTKVETIEFRKADDDGNYEKMKNLIALLLVETS